MKPLMLLLLLSCAQACVPFHSNVSIHNNLLAPALLGSECLNRTEPDFNNPIACSEAQLLTVYPSVDSRISSGLPSYVLWRYASEATLQRMKVTDSHGCESTYTKTPLFQSISVDLRADFMNETYIRENISENPILIPVPLSALSFTDGSNITLELNGTFFFQYSYYELKSSWSCNELGVCGCSQQPSGYFFNITKNISSNLSYEVEGGPVLHFLSKPVLYEQWAGNPVFEDMVFSKRKFCNVSILLNNITLNSSQLYSFEITNDSSDAWHIISAPMNPSLGWREIHEYSTPIQIESYPEAFSYINIFTKDYSAQGKHNITIILQDQFNSSFSQRFGIVSRFLTIDDSLGEDNSTNISDSDLYRPSAKPSETGYAPLLLGLSLAGLALFIIIFFRK
ncbi:MAG: hypothetical protein PHS02_01340 [Candidatus ainarchaeum sp.]|nr:hypothetical protein [Candidatus ainarchaeum sp.]